MKVVDVWLTQKAPAWGQVTWECLLVLESSPGTTPSNKGQNRTKKSISSLLRHGVYLAHSSLAEMVGRWKVLVIPAV